ncbi:MAG: AAA family ATPase [Coprothermobacterota bacterium]|nr:AAA family ATPase [Coprothermobacterota bacterium]
MRIERFTIDGFGIFRDFHQDGLEVGTSIFLGANEAGKSTLMAFFRRMLFGWKDKKNNPNPYQPLCGGNYGGELTLLAADGSHTRIARSGADLKNLKVTLADGSRGSEIDLARLFGPVNEQVYQSVYAFGLHELQSMNALDKAGIRERIYSAGAGLGGVSLQAVRNVFQGEAKKLFLPSGSNPEMNRLLGEIKEIDQSLKGIAQGVAAYDQYRGELQETEATLAQLSKDREDVAERLRSVESLLLAWGDWVDMQEARRELEKTPVLENFPEGGFLRLENLLAACEELRIGCDELTESIQKRKAQVDAIALDASLLVVREEISRLERECEKYRSAWEDSKQKEALRAQHAEGLIRTLKEISPAWREEDLESFDISIAAGEKLKTAGKELSLAEKDVERQEDLLKGIASRAAETRAAFEEGKQNEQARSQALGGRGEAQILERKQVLHRIRAGKARQAELENRHEANQRALAQAHAAQAPWWPALAFFTFAILMGVLFLAVYSLPWLAVVGFLVFAASGGLYLFTLRRRPLSKDSGPLEGDLLTQDQALFGELRRVQAQLLADLQGCGLEQTSDAFQVEEEIQAAEDLLSLLKQANQEKLALARLQQKLDREEAERLGREGQRDQTRETLRQKQAAWQAFLQSAHLELTLSPEGALAAFTKAEIAREKQRAILQLDLDLARMASAISSFQASLADVLEACHRSGQRGDPLLQVSSLARELALEIDKERQQKDLRSGVEKDLPQLDEMKRKLEAREGELKAFLLLGSATDPEQFRSNQANWIKRRALEETIRQSERNLRRIRGEGAAFESFLTALAVALPQDLQGSKEQLADAQRRLEEEAQTMAEKKGGLLGSIQELERTDEGEVLRARRIDRIDQLAHAARRWAVLTLADTFLGKAMRKFEQERQPEVLRVAQEFFARLTGGRYTAIVRPMDEEKLYVMDRDGSRKALDELSTGTAEQLYLALRFGFISEFERGNEPLPIILDDVFVNFDPERFQAACGAVGKLAETHQVFTFTCHPQIAEKMAQMMPSSRVIQLPALA